MKSENNINQNVKFMINNKQVDIKEEQLDMVKIACRESFKAFISLVQPDFVFKKFHEELIDKLEKVAKGEIKKLLVSMPPRYGKSQTAIVNYVAWFLGNHPNKEVMVAGFWQDLVDEHSFKIREILRNPIYEMIFWVKLHDNSQNISWWNTDKGGVCHAVGRGWSATGKWYHLGIIDDMYKDDQEAQSDKISDTIWSWYQTVFSARAYLHDYRMIAIMTRWHNWDLIGRLQEVEPEEWDTLYIPAIENEGEPEELWRSSFEERFPIKELKKVKKVKSPSQWQALYQCNPIPEGNGDFKQDMFKYYNEIDITSSLWRLKRYTFVDPAISQKDSADYTAIVTIWVDELGQIYILDVVRERMTPDKIIKTIFDKYDKYTPEKVWLEVVAFQKMLAIEIQKEMNNRGKYFTLEEVTPMGEKNARMKTILSPIYEKRSVYHIKGDVNQEMLEKEILSFPNSRHDDCMDALSGAVKLIWKGGSVGIVDEYWKIMEMGGRNGPYIMWRNGIIWIL